MPSKKPRGKPADLANDIPGCREVSGYVGDVGRWPTGFFPRNVRYYLGQMRGAWTASNRGLWELLTLQDAGVQLAGERRIVIEGRRVTFVLQKMKGVPNFGETFLAWYVPLRERMKADPLLCYFNILRSYIEKEGLPDGVAEIYNINTGEPIGDVAFVEDQVGVWTKGEVRPTFDRSQQLQPESVGIRSIRFPNPPQSHLGQPVLDGRFEHLAALYLDYLWNHVYMPAREEFGNLGL